MTNGKFNDPVEGSRPVPDPTELTTQALYREIGGLRELLEQAIAGLGTTVEQKFDLVERQRKEQKDDTQKAVDAALAAAKEAVSEQTAASEKATDKSEAAINKLVEQQGATFATEVSSIRREMGEVKDRVGAIEQQRIGGRENKAGLYAAVSIGIAVLLAVIAVIGFFAAGA